MSLNPYSHPSGLDPEKKGEWKVKIPKLVQARVGGWGREKEIFEHRELESLWDSRGPLGFGLWFNKLNNCLFCGLECQDRQTSSLTESLLCLSSLRPFQWLFVFLGQTEVWGWVNRLCLAVPLLSALPDRCRSPQDEFKVLRWPKAG